MVFSTSSIVVHCGSATPTGHPDVAIAQTAGDEFQQSKLKKPCGSDHFMHQSEDDQIAISGSFRSDWHLHGSESCGNPNFVLCVHSL